MQKHLTHRDLKISYQAGTFGTIMTGLTADYFVPLLLLMGGTTFHVGLLNSLLHLCTSLGQLPSADLAAKAKSRKSIILLCILFQSIMLLLLAILAFMASNHLYILILLVSLLSVFGALNHPCWVSFLSDLVSHDKRGEYFGWRTRNLGFITIIATFTAGTILFIFNKTSPFLGFALIFILACISRLLSYYQVSKMSEPALEYDKSQSFNFWGFFSRVKESNFVKFVLFVSSINFSVNLAAPFFSIYMLNELKFNYLIYTMINITAPIVLYAVISRWGRHADQIGNLKVLKIVAPLIGLIPLLWILNQNPFYLISVEVLAGFLWAGFNLCSSNYIIDAVTPEKRTRCIAYFHVVNGIGMAAGALIGSELIRILPPLRGEQILSVFLISSLLRMVFGLTLPRLIKEVRMVERISSQELLFSMIGVKPIAGIERKSLEL